MTQRTIECLSASGHDREAMHLTEMAYSNRCRVLFGIEGADDMLAEAALHTAAAEVLRELAVDLAS